MPHALALPGNMVEVVAFNPNFLAQSVSAGTGAEVTIKLVDALKPATIVDESSCERLLMPVRVP